MTLPPKHPYASQMESWSRWCDLKHIEEPIEKGKFPDIGFLTALLRSKRDLNGPVRTQLAKWIRDKPFRGPKQGGRPPSVKPDFKGWAIITTAIERGAYPDMDQIAKGLSTSKPVPVSVRLFLAAEIGSDRMFLPKGRRSDINPFADDWTRAQVQKVFDQQAKIVDAERAALDPRDYVNRRMRRPLEEKLRRTSIALEKEEDLHIKPGKIRQVIEGGGKWKR